MDLSDFILEVAATYDRSEGLKAPAQQLLKDAPLHLADHVPPGIKVIGSGGKGLATFTPWVGFFDPDETTSPQYGVYVVYLFSEDLEHLTLTLNQGIEGLRGKYGDTVARDLLTTEAQAIRALLKGETLLRLDVTMDLGSTGQRQRAYEAGNIASVSYETGSLPDETTLRADLARFLAVYREAIVARQNSPSTSNRGAAGSADQATAAVLADFRPKSADEYIARLRGRTLTKSRTHEHLVREFGERAISLGFKASTPHPRDLVLRRDGQDWLVEVKVVYRGNATDAVRSAIGQLFTYRYFYYRAGPPPALVALFSESVGLAYCDLLASLRIGAVWKKGQVWRCSPSADLGDLAVPDVG